MTTYTTSLPLKYAGIIYFCLISGDHPFRETTGT